VPRAAQIRLGLPIVHRRERLRDGILRPALRVALDGVFEHPPERLDQLGDHLARVQLQRDLRRLGDHQPDAVAERFADGRRGGRSRFRLAQTAEAFDGFFYPAICHGCPISSIARIFFSYRASKDP
jgi:hypothetical protein